MLITSGSVFVCFLGCKPPHCAWFVFFKLFAAVGAEAGRGSAELVCSGSELADPPGVPLALLLCDNLPAEMERPRCWRVACVL